MVLWLYVRHGAPPRNATMATKAPRVNGRAPPVSARSGGEALRSLPFCVRALNCLFVCLFVCLCVRSAGVASSLALPTHEMRALLQQHSGGVYSLMMHQARSKWDCARSGIAL